MRHSRWPAMSEARRAASNGRGGEIRTHDLYVPNVALYQAKLRPDFVREGTANPVWCHASKLKTGPYRALLGCDYLQVHFAAERRGCPGNRRQGHGSIFVIEHTVDG